MNERAGMGYLLECLQAVQLVPYPWDGEDRNIAAFRSKEELVAWYGQPPGVVNQPYRDRGFYARELANLSWAVGPRIVVEFGTCQGIGTCLLHWLNPTARLITVDINTETFMPGDRRVPIGHLAKHNGVPCKYVTMEACRYAHGGVDLCFIDADHSYEAVRRDSERAWLNHSIDHIWAIAWHDHNDRHPGVMRAVAEFCVEKKLVLRSRDDSDTVWVFGEP